MEKEASRYLKNDWQALVRFIHQNNLFPKLRLANIWAFLSRFYAKIPPRFRNLTLLGDRLTVGQQTLTLLIVVRVHVSQPFL